MGTNDHTAAAGAAQAGAGAAGAGPADAGCPDSATGLAPATGPESEPAEGPQSDDAAAPSDTPNTSTDPAIPGGSQPAGTAETADVDVADAPGAVVDAAQALAQRDAYLADLQRMTAEFANFRRQTGKRNAEIVARAASGLVADLLPVLDACEAAARQGIEGTEAVHSQLLGVLRGRGLSVLGAVGEAFDPNFHEAVLAEESPDGAAAVPVVAEVLRTGYSWQGHVLRAAMVRVRS